jgi:DnaB-like helicase C terminal domain
VPARRAPGATRRCPGTRWSGGARGTDATRRRPRQSDAGVNLPPALVRLNRNRARRADKRPTLPDLRESGDLENTADSVIGLYRHGLDNPSSAQRGLAELIVLKKRLLGDDVGTIRRLVWLGESYRAVAYEL